MSTTRIALRLALGILCGVALVLLPAAFSSNPPAAAPASNATSTGTIFGRQLPAPLAGSSGPPLGSSSFVTIILFILLPSAIFSLVIRRWAEQRARLSLGDSVEQ